MPTALFLSPHLDDAVFSCGGTMAVLAERGWRTVLATAFTATVLPATGFALACQLDKGLPPEADYMALRREEDRVAAGHLGVTELHWLDLPEAPHRGYHSAPALFGGMAAGDAVWRTLAPMLRDLIAGCRPDQLFAPQGLGGHVDHEQMIRAVEAVADGHPVAWYRDTPYAIRAPGARPIVAAPPAATVPIGPALARKVAAACAYTTQIGFQFGGVSATEEALRRFAASEGGERFSGKLNLAMERP